MPQKVRRAKRWYQRKSGFIAAAVGALLLVGAPITYATMEQPGSPIAKGAKSFFAMLQERSPGARTSAELTKTKVKRPLAQAAPHERALAKVQPPELPKEFVLALAPPLPVTSEAPLITGLTPPPFGPQVSQSSGPPIVPPVIPGGGTPIVPGTPDTPGPPGPPTPPPPLPEPGTWAMLLLGFAVLGQKFRRQRAIAVAAV